MSMSWTYGIDTTAIEGNPFPRNVVTEECMKYIFPGNTSVSSLRTKATKIFADTPRIMGASELGGPHGVESRSWLESAEAHWFEPEFQKYNAQVQQRRFERLETMLRFNSNASSVEELSPANQCAVRTLNILKGAEENVKNFKSTLDAFNYFTQQLSVVKESLEGLGMPALTLSAARSKAFKKMYKEHKQELKGIFEDITAEKLSFTVGYEGTAAFKALPLRVQGEVQSLAKQAAEGTAHRYEAFRQECLGIITDIEQIKEKMEQGRSKGELLELSQDLEIKVNRLVESLSQVAYYLNPDFTPTDPDQEIRPAWVEQLISNALPVITMGVTTGYLFNFSNIFVGTMVGVMSTIAMFSYAYGQMTFGNIAAYSLKPSNKILTLPGIPKRYVLLEGFYVLDNLDPDDTAVREALQAFAEGSGGRFRYHEDADALLFMAQDTISEVEQAAILSAFGNKQGKKHQEQKAQAKRFFDRAGHEEKDTVLYQMEHSRGQPMKRAIRFSNTGWLVPTQVLTAFRYQFTKDSSSWIESNINDANSPVRGSMKGLYVELQRMDAAANIMAERLEALQAEGLLKGKLNREQLRSMAFDLALTPADYDTDQQCIVLDEVQNAGVGSDMADRIMYNVGSGGGEIAIVSGLIKHVDSVLLKDETDLRRINRYGTFMESLVRYGFMTNFMKVMDKEFMTSFIQSLLERAGFSASIAKSALSGTLSTNGTVPRSMLFPAYTVPHRAVYDEHYGSYTKQFKAMFVDIDAKVLMFKKHITKEEIKKIMPENAPKKLMDMLDRAYDIYQEHYAAYSAQFKDIFADIDAEDLVFNEHITMEEVQRSLPRGTSRSVSEMLGRTYIDAQIIDALFVDGGDVFALKVPVGDAESVIEGLLGKDVITDVQADELRDAVSRTELVREMHSWFDLAQDRAFLKAEDALTDTLEDIVTTSGIDPRTRIPRLAARKILQRSYDEVQMQAVAGAAFLSMRGVEHAGEAQEQAVGACADALVSRYSLSAEDARAIAQHVVLNAKEIEQRVKEANSEHIISAQNMSEMLDMSSLIVHVFRKDQNIGIAWWMYYLLTDIHEKTLDARVKARNRWETETKRKVSEFFGSTMADVNLFRPDVCPAGADNLKSVLKKDSLREKLFEDPKSEQLSFKKDALKVIEALRKAGRLTTEEAKVLKLYLRMTEIYKEEFRESVPEEQREFYARMSRWPLGKDDMRGKDVRTWFLARVEEANGGNYKLYHMAQEGHPEKTADLRDRLGRYYHIDAGISPGLAQLFIIPMFQKLVNNPFTGSRFLKTFEERFIREVCTAAKKDTAQVLYADKVLNEKNVHAMYKLKRTLELKDVRSSADLGKRSVQNRREQKSRFLAEASGYDVFSDIKKHNGAALITLLGAVYDQLESRELPFQKNMEAVYHEESARWLEEMMDAFDKNARLTMQEVIAQKERETGEVFLKDAQGEYIDDPRLPVTKFQISQMADIFKGQLVGANKELWRTARGFLQQVNDHNIGLLQASDVLGDQTVVKRIADTIFALESAVKKYGQQLRKLLIDADPSISAIMNEYVVTDDDLSLEKMEQLGALPAYTAYVNWRQGISEVKKNKYLLYLEDNVDTALRVKAALVQQGWSADRIVHYASLAEFKDAGGIKQHPYAGVLLDMELSPEGTADAERFYTDPAHTLPIFVLSGMNYETILKALPDIPKENVFTDKADIAQINEGLENVLFEKEWREIKERAKAPIRASIVQEKNRESKDILDLCARTEALDKSVQEVIEKNLGMIGTCRQWLSIPQLWSEETEAAFDVVINGKNEKKTAPQMIDHILKEYGQALQKLDDVLQDPALDKSIAEQLQALIELEKADGCCGGLQQEYKALAHYAALGSLYGRISKILAYGINQERTRYQPQHDIPGKQIAEDATRAIFGEGDLRTHMPHNSADTFKRGELTEVDIAINGKGDTFSSLFSDNLVEYREKMKELQDLSVLDHAVLKHQLTDEEVVSLDGMHGIAYHAGTKTVRMTADLALEDFKEIMKAKGVRTSTQNILQKLYLETHPQERKHMEDQLVLGDAYESAVRSFEMALEISEPQRSEVLNGAFYSVRHIGGRKYAINKKNLVCALGDISKDDQDILKKYAYTGAEYTNGHLMFRSVISEKQQHALLQEPLSGPVIETLKAFFEQWASGSLLMEGSLKDVSVFRNSALANKNERALIRKLMKQLYISSRDVGVDQWLSKSFEDLNAEIQGLSGLGRPLTNTEHLALSISQNAYEAKHCLKEVERLEDALQKERTSVVKVENNKVPIDGSFHSYRAEISTNGEIEVYKDGDPYPLAGRVKDSAEEKIVLDTLRRDLQKKNVAQTDKVMQLRLQWYKARGKAMTAVDLLKLGLIAHKQSTSKLHAKGEEMFLRLEHRYLQENILDLKNTYTKLESAGQDLLKSLKNSTIAAGQRQMNVFRKKERELYGRKELIEVAMLQDIKKKQTVVEQVKRSISLYLEAQHKEYGIVKELEQLLRKAAFSTPEQREVSAELLRAEKEYEELKERIDHMERERQYVPLELEAREEAAKRRVLMLRGQIFEMPRNPLQAFFPMAFKLKDEMAKGKIKDADGLKTYIQGSYARMNRDVFEMDQKMYGFGKDKNDENILVHMENSAVEAMRLQMKSYDVLAAESAGAAAENVVAEAAQDTKGDLTARTVPSFWYRLGTFRSKDHKPYYRRLFFEFLEFKFRWRGFKATNLDLELGATVLEMLYKRVSEFTKDHAENEYPFDAVLLSMSDQNIFDFSAVRYSDDPNIDEELKIKAGFSADHFYKDVLEQFVLRDREQAAALRGGAANDEAFKERVLQGYIDRWCSGLLTDKEEHARKTQLRKHPEQAERIEAEYQSLIDERRAMFMERMKDRKQFVNDMLNEVVISSYNYWYHGQMDALYMLAGKVQSQPLDKLPRYAVEDYIQPVLALITDAGAVRINDRTALTAEELMNVKAYLAGEENFRTIAGRLQMSVRSWPQLTSYMANQLVDDLKSHQKYVDLHMQRPAEYQKEFEKNARRLRDETLKTLDVIARENRDKAHIIAELSTVRGKITEHTFGTDLTYTYTGPQQEETRAVFNAVVDQFNLKVHNLRTRTRDRYDWAEVFKGPWYTWTAQLRPDVKVAPENRNELGAAITNIRKNGLKNGAWKGTDIARIFRGPHDKRRRDFNSPPPWRKDSVSMEERVALDVSWAQSPDHYREWGFEEELNSMLFKFGRFVQKFEEQGLKSDHPTPAVYRARIASAMEVYRSFREFANKKGGLAAFEQQLDALGLRTFDPLRPYKELVAANDLQPGDTQPLAQLFKEFKATTITYPDLTLQEFTVMAAQYRAMSVFWNDSDSEDLRPSKFSAEVKSDLHNLFDTELMFECISNLFQIEIQQQFDTDNNVFPSSHDRQDSAFKRVGGTVRRHWVAVLQSMQTLGGPGRLQRTQAQNGKFFQQMMSKYLNWTEGLMGCYLDMQQKSFFKASQFFRVPAKMFSGDVDRLSGIIGNAYDKVTKPQWFYNTQLIAFALIPIMLVTSFITLGGLYHLAGGIGLGLTGAAFLGGTIGHIYNSRNPGYESFANPFAQIAGRVLPGLWQGTKLAGKTALATMMVSGLLLTKSVAAPMLVAGVLGATVGLIGLPSLRYIINKKRVTADKFKRTLEDFKVGPFEVFKKDIMKSLVHHSPAFMLLGLLAVFTTGAVYTGMPMLIALGGTFLLSGIAPLSKEWQKPSSQNYKTILRSIAANGLISTQTLGLYLKTKNNRSVVNAGDALLEFSQSRLAGAIRTGILTTLLGFYLFSGIGPLGFGLAFTWASYYLPRSISAMNGTPVDKVPRWLFPALTGAATMVVGPALAAGALFSSTAMLVGLFAPLTASFAGVMAAPVILDYPRRHWTTEQRKDRWELYKKLINKTPLKLAPFLSNTAKEYNQEGFKNPFYAWMTDDQKMYQQWLGYYVTGTQWDSEDLATTFRILLRGYASLFDQANKGKADAQNKMADWEKQMWRWRTGGQALNPTAEDFHLNYGQLRGNNKVGETYARMTFNYMSLPKIAMAVSLAVFFGSAGSISPILFGGGSMFFRNVVLFSLMGFGNYFYWKRNFKGYAMYKGASGEAVEDALASNDLLSATLNRGFTRRLLKEEQFEFNLSTPSDRVIKAPFFENTPDRTESWVFFATYGLCSVALGSYLFGTLGSSIYSWPMIGLAYWLLQPAVALGRGFFGMGREGGLPHVEYTKYSMEVIDLLVGAKDQNADEDAQRTNVARILAEGDLFAAQDREDREHTATMRKNVKQARKNDHPILLRRNIRKFWVLKNRGMNLAHMTMVRDRRRADLARVRQVAVYRAQVHLDPFRNRLMMLKDTYENRVKVLPLILNVLKDSVRAIHPDWRNALRSLTLKPAMYSVRTRDMYLDLAKYLFLYAPNRFYRLLKPAASDVRSTADQRDDDQP